ncbi:MAG: sodium:solute symporter family protein [Patescibacteria group bacterium]
MQIAGLDIAIIVIYLLSILGFGLFISRKEDTDGFFVNNRKTKLFLLIFTSLSTSVGAGTVLGVASAAYTTGISFALSFIVMSALGWWLIGYLAPRIKVWADRNKAYTLGDFWESRFSHRTRIIGGAVTLLSFFFLTAIQFVAFARLIEVVTNVNFYTALVATALVTIVYTVLAGIKGDFYTDAIQFFVMFPVFIFLLVKGFSIISLGDLFSSVPPEFLSPYNFAGPVFFYASVILGFALLVTSMDVWQRIFAANSAKTARMAFYLTGVLKVIVISASMIIGFMALRLVPGVEADSAIFALMAKILPTGLLGLGFASIFAILMSTVDSMIMVGSATLTKDFYLVHHPQTDAKKTLRIGRLTALLFGLIGLMVAFAIPSIVRLSVTSVQMLLIFAPAILGGLLWKRVNEKAAFWSILLGFIATLVSLPFIPNYAFLPGLIVCSVTFFFFVFKNKQNSLITPTT